jgi:polyhydroxybutyrate depolymerase
MEALEQGSIDVAGVRRGYWLARAPQREGRPGTAPLLIVLHGSGMNGRAMARWTGLAERGPAAGITTVFPDGWKRFWHIARPPDAEPGLDDALFLAELSAHLEAAGAARSWPVFLAGISNGARFAEHVARHALLPVTGLFLVAGTALEYSRRLAPQPFLRASVIVMMGSADPVEPYAGGQLSRRGLTGLLLKRRAARHGELPGEDVVAGAEAVAADWAAGNGIEPDPVTEELPTPPGDLTVTRKTWAAAGSRSVVLYRVNGGGHGWPGGTQSIPARIVGPTARDLDATGVLIEMARRESDAGNRPTLGGGPG